MKKYIAAVTLGSLLGMQDFKANASNTFNVNVFGDNSIAGGIEVQKIEEGSEYLMGGEAHNTGFAFSYDALSMNPREVIVNYNIGAGINNVGTCQISAGIKSVNLYPYSGAKGADVTAVSSHPSDLYCEQASGLGVKIRNYFSLSTALTGSGIFAGAGAILFAVGGINANRAKHKVYGAFFKDLSDNLDNLDSTKKYYFMTDKIAFSSHQKLSLIAYVAYHKAIIEGDGSLTHLGNVLIEYLNDAASAGSDYTRPFFLEIMRYHHLNQSHKSDEMKSRFDAFEKEFKREFNHSSYDLFGKLIKDYDIDAAKYDSVLDLYNSSKYVYKYLTLTEKMETLGSDFFSIIQDQKSGELKLNSDSSFQSGRTRTTNDAQYKVPPKHFGNMHKGLKYSGIGMITLSFVPLISCFFETAFEGYDFDVQVKRAEKINSAANITQTYYSPLGGSYFVGNQGASVLMVPTGEKFVILAADSRLRGNDGAGGNDNGAGENDNVINPNGYRVERILPGVALGATEACVKNAESEKDVVSTLFTPTENGLNIANFDGQAKVISHKNIFENRSIVSVTLSQGVQDSKCAAFVHTGQWVTDAKTNKLVWQEAFYVSKKDAPSLTATTIAEDQFFKLEHGAFDTFGNAYFVGDNSNVLQVLKSKINATIEDVIGIPAQTSIVDLMTLPNGRVLAVASTGEAYVSSEKSEFIKIKSDIDFRNYDVVAAVIDGDSDKPETISKPTLALFYPSKAAEKAKNGIMGAYLVSLTQDNFAFLNAKTEKILADEVVLTYQEKPALLTTAKLEDIDAEGQVTKEQNYHMLPQELFNNMGSADALVRKSKVYSASWNPEIASPKVLYTTEEGNILSYNSETQEQTETPAGLNENQIKSDGVLLYPLWHSTAVVVAQGNTLKLQNTKLADVKMRDLEGNTIEKFVFPSDTKIMISAVAKLSEKFGEILIVTTENHGAYVFVPELNSEGYAIEGSYKLASQLFTDWGFQFTGVEVDYDNKLVFFVQDGGKLKANTSLTDTLLLLTEENFEPLENETAIP